MTCYSSHLWTPAIELGRAEVQIDNWERSRNGSSLELVLLTLRRTKDALLLKQSQQVHDDDFDCEVNEFLAMINRAGAIAMLKEHQTDGIFLIRTQFRDRSVSEAQERLSQAGAKKSD